MLQAEQPFLILQIGGMARLSRRSVCHASYSKGCLTPAQAPKVKHFDASGDKKKKTQVLTHSLTASLGASEGEAVKQKSEAVQPNALRPWRSGFPWKRSG